MNDSEMIIESQLRECFGRIVYTHKTYEKCSDIMLKRADCFKAVQLILSAITAGGFFVLIFQNDLIASVAGGIASLLLLIVNTYLRSFDPSSLAEKYKQSAIRLWGIREKYLSLIIDFSSGASNVNEVIKQRDSICSELELLYSDFPPTFDAGYKRAQKALKISEDYTFSDKEIDAFLPASLKRSQD